MADLGTIAGVLGKYSHLISPLVVLNKYQQTACWYILDLVSDGVAFC